MIEILKLWIITKKTVWKKGQPGMCFTPYHVFISFIVQAQWVDSCHPKSRHFPWLGYLSLPVKAIVTSWCRRETGYSTILLMISRLRDPNWRWGNVYGWLLPKITAATCLFSDCIKFDEHVSRSRFGSSFVDVIVNQTWLSRSINLRLASKTMQN